MNILFLCTGNSARSILAEAIANSLPGFCERFRAYSAGSQPKGAINPGALETLRQLRISIDRLRSKSWDEFDAPGTPQMDFVITLCNEAANEVCPLWPGHPVSAHWGMPDPAALPDEAERRRAFSETAVVLKRRLELFASLPLDKLDRGEIKQQLDRIAHS
jgi:arsenate reductase (thioredoxin)